MERGMREESSEERFGMTASENGEIIYADCIFALSVSFRL
jgi:hypothetical protein